VVWGDQSWEEMFYTAVRYRWTDETSAHMNTYDEALNAGRMMGMLDTNVDGKIEKAELKGRMGDMIAKNFDAIDRNHDGVIDKDELAAMQKMMGGQRRRQADAAQPAAPAAAPAATPTAGGR
jgi:EF hand